MPNQLIGVSMAKKKKSATELVYQIKDLLDDLELLVNQDDDYISDDEEDIDDDLEIDDEEDEDN
jgi:hypothetical protein